MVSKVSVLILVLVCSIPVVALCQNLDGRPYTPGVDPNIDLFIGDWKKSMPRLSHGSLIERDILTKGDPLNPPAPGAVLHYINRFVYASLDTRAATSPTTLKNEQEILFIISGNGVVSTSGKTAELLAGVAVLIPADIEFTIRNTGDEQLTMYLICEPIPAGFRPNKNLLVRDETAMPVISYNGHWCHIVKRLFTTEDGLGTLESILTVAFDPMTMGHPHSHEQGCEEVWTGLKGTSIAFLGKQIRMQPAGVGYLIPPDGNTPHSNVNTSNEQVKLLYFARYRDHEVRK